MTSSRFNFGPTSKTLNLFLLQFIERSGSETMVPISWNQTKNLVYLKLEYDLSYILYTIFTYIT